MFVRAANTWISFKLRLYLNCICFVMLPCSNQQRSSIFIQIKHPQLTILSIRSDEGLMLGTPALETVYHGQFTPSETYPLSTTTTICLAHCDLSCKTFYSSKIFRYHDRRHWSQVFYDVQREWQWISNVWPCPYSTRPDANGSFKGSMKWVVVLVYMTWR